MTAAGLSAAALPGKTCTPLRALPTAAALVNTQGRVIVSNTARLVTGSLVRKPDVASFFAGGEAARSEPGLTLHRCGDVPIVLLVGDMPYYGRFGFKPVPPGRIILPGPVDPARLLALELMPSMLEAASGRVEGYAR